MEIVFTGLRPGEKLFEELSTAQEYADKTRHPKIFVGRIEAHPWDTVLRGIDELRALAQRGGDEVRAALARIVPEYRCGAEDTEGTNERAAGRGG